MIRALLLAAGLSGAAGVALSAAAAHITGGATLATAGQFLLFHAPAFLALAALAKAEALPRRIVSLCASLLAAGLVLFAGYLCVRVFFARPLFPNAAPGGGILLITGWLTIALAGVFFSRR